MRFARFFAFVFVIILLALPAREFSVNAIETATPEPISETLPEDALLINMLYTREVSEKAPRGTSAYVIAAETADHARLNSISALANILTNIKSGGIYFEMSEFKANSSGEAVAIVSLGDYEKKRFLSLFKKLANEAADEAESAGSQISLFAIETRIPPKVLSDTDTNSIIAWLYGVFGSEAQENSTAVSLIPNKISLKDGVFATDLTVSAETAEAAQTATDSISEIASFTGMKIPELG